MIPSPSEYRLNEDQIDRSGAVCMARVLGDYLTCDSRWKPHVYYEAQCDRPPVSGKDLCKTCGSREGRKHKLWIGRITEEPLAHCHMLGTEWSKKCKWMPEEAENLIPEPLVAEPLVAEPLVAEPIVTTMNVEDPDRISLVEATPSSDIPVVESPPLHAEDTNYTICMKDVMSVALITLSVGFTLYHFLWANKPSYIQRWSDGSL